MLTHLLILATTAAAVPASDPDGGLTIKGLYIGGSTLVAIVTAIGGYYRGKTKRVDVQDPLNISAPADKTYITETMCSARMQCQHNAFVGWNQRLEDAVRADSKSVDEKFAALNTSIDKKFSDAATSVGELKNLLIAMKK